MTNMVGDYVIVSKTRYGQFLFFAMLENGDWAWDTDIMKASFFSTVKAAKELIDEYLDDDAMIHYCAGTFDFHFDETPVTHDDVK